MYIYICIYIYIYISPLSGKQFPTRPEGSGKTENVNLIKFAENCHGAKRKQQTISSVLCPILLKLVSIDAELNCALENERYFCQVIGCGTQKSSQTSKSGLKLKKHDLWHLQPQNWQVLGQNFFDWNMHRNSGGEIGQVRFSFGPFNL